ncbi:hypothetical protein [Actinomycetospora lemnae]|uniref:hypothetical protein n=1 Tax=Actinomycetospora lemnae TaxID=3019891 RepID=UPI0023664A14|nr:hypothetical protein [Actinomycetospora sp. DW7H6]
MLVLSAAVGFDVAADERPIHTATVALAAVIVGVGRLWMQGRLRGVFAAVNLAIIGQPAVHAVTKLTYVADAVPHAHGWPETFSSVALHIAVALLLVAVSASEPVCAFVAGTIVRSLRLATSPRSSDAPSPIRPGRHDEPGDIEQQLLSSRCVSRRGPPSTPVLAG